jgi:cytoskeleton protein RodZ
MATKKKEAVIEKVQQEVPEILSELGGVFKKAREAQKLSIQDVRNRLHINENQIIALEQDDFGSFGDSTRARGFIRIYARLLGLNEESLLDKHRQLYPSETLNSLDVKTETLAMGARRTGVPRYAFIVVGFVLLGLSIWFFSMFNSAGFSQKDEVELATSQEPLSEPLLPSPEPVQEGVGQSTVKEIQLPATPQNTELAKPAAISTAPTTPAKTVLNVGNLKFVVSSDTWVDVKDGSDKTIFTRVLKPGIDEVIQATPPLKVHLGNVKGVQLIYNGKPVDYSASIYGNTARVTLAE